MTQRVQHIQEQSQSSWLGLSMGYSYLGNPCAPNLEAGIIPTDLELAEYSYSHINNVPVHSKRR